MKKKIGCDMEKMRKKTKIIVLVEIAIVLCSVFLMAITAIAAEQTTKEISAITMTASEAETLDIYGNANEDDMIDMRDLTYVKLIFFGKKPETELADAKYDGKINPLDFIQIKLIIVGKEKELTVVDAADRIVTVKKPVKRIVVVNARIVETMRSIRAADKIVGVSNTVISDKTYYPEFSEYPNVGLSTTPDLEKILELRPDVVFLYATSFTDASENIQNTLQNADPDIRVLRFDCHKIETYADEVEKLVSQQISF